MTKVQKQEIINKPTIAYYSGWTGIEIKDIENGIEDYIIYVAGAWGSPENYTVHRTKIYSTTDGKNYFKYNGYRIYLNECLRTNISSL